MIFLFAFPKTTCADPSLDPQLEGTIGFIQHLLNTSKVKNSNRNHHHHWSESGHEVSGPFFLLPPNQLIWLVLTTPLPCYYPLLSSFGKEKWPSWMLICSSLSTAQLFLALYHTVLSQPSWRETFLVNRTYRSPTGILLETKKHRDLKQCGRLGGSCLHLQCDCD